MGKKVGWPNFVTSHPNVTSSCWHAGSPVFSDILAPPVMFQKEEYHENQRYTHFANCLIL